MHTMSECRNNMPHGLLSLNKQTSFSSLSHLAKNVKYSLWYKTSISFPVYRMRYPTAALFSRVKPKTSMDVSLIYIRMIMFISRHDCKCSSEDVFLQHLFWFKTCSKSPLYIPNDLQIDLQESNLHGKEWELDSSIPVSINCGRREQRSPGSDGPPAATCLLGTICHNPSKLMLSRLCWSHSLHWCGLCDGATIWKQNTICHIQKYMLRDRCHWLR